MQSHHKIVTVVVSCFIAAACGSGGSSGPGGSPDEVAAEPSRVSSAAPQQTGERLRELPAQLDFTAKTLDGTTFRGSSLAEKPVVFWFWAPWCPKCRSEAAAVAGAATTYGDRVGFVGVAGLDGLPAMKRFVSQTGTGGFTHLNDSKGRLYRRFGVTVQSSYVFMNRDGKIKRASGPLTEAELARQLRALGA